MRIEERAGDALKCPQVIAPITRMQTSKHSLPIGLHSIAANSVSRAYSPGGDRQSKVIYSGHPALDPGQWPLVSPPLPLFASGPMTRLSEFSGLVSAFDPIATVHGGTPSIRVSPAPTGLG